MCPEPMVSSRDSQTSPKVVYHGPTGGFPSQRSPESANAAHQWDSDNQEYIEPIDVLVPILLRDGLVGDVWLLRIILWIPIWLIGTGLSGWLRYVLWINGSHAGDGLVGRHGVEAIETRGKVKEMEQVVTSAPTAQGDAIGLSVSTMLELSTRTTISHRETVSGEDQW